MAQDVTQSNVAALRDRLDVLEVAVQQIVDILVKQGWLIPTEEVDADPKH